jgi:hypothetical protein
MSDTRQNEDKNGRLMRRGHPIYTSNPSLSDSLPVMIKPKKPSAMGESYMISKDGDVLAKGEMAFIERQEVDNEQFVKIYLAGIRQYGQLSKSGAIMFEYVYKELSGHNGRDRDTVAVNYLLAQIWMDSLTRRTYERGIKELLDKSFIFRSLTSEHYYVNVRYMFNGDRLILAKQYTRKSENSAEFEFPFYEQPAIDLESQSVND